MSPTWSPDGRQVAFVRATALDRATIYTTPSVGGQERKILDLVGRVVTVSHFVPMIAWSPDGEWIAFGEKAGTTTPARTSRVSLTTFERKAMTSPPIDSIGDTEPQLSPDGKTLAFVRGSSGSWGNEDVWLQAVTGEAATQLTFGKYR